MFDFRDCEASAPDYDQVAAEYRDLFARVDGADAPGDALAAIDVWDRLRRRLETWRALVQIRFRQDTRDEVRRRDRELCDQLGPKFTALAVDMMRRLATSPHREAFVAAYGPQAFALWKCEADAFSPAIEADLTREAELDARYTELLASARFDFHGESCTLTQLLKFAEDPDRAVRRDAAHLRWGWFAQQQAALDDLYDQLVHCRRTIADKLGQPSFVPVGYWRMKRIGYGEADVQEFRRQVREEVVPLCRELRRRQAQRLGLDQLMAWDEAVHDPAGNPRPRGDHDALIDRAVAMFAELGGGLDRLFAHMRQSHLLDLQSREGKAGGGFCEGLPLWGLPFIYANFNGTKSDVEVFTHEMGHAFQNYQSRDAPLVDYLWPTTEACEIHSMGLELLTWPQMEQFFGDQAERFRRLHLSQRLLFLPYGAAIDHFQHLVYAEPDASPDRRAAMWRELEATYLPDVSWGELAHPASGRRWQAQLHVFGAPFYYVDYALALTCALQLWAWAARDRPAAMASYFELCRQGGRASFGELVAAAGLKSPFAPGCLSDAVGHAREYLDQAD